MLKKTKLFTSLSSAICLMYIAFLCLTTVYSADDYWYSTFLNDGLVKYAELIGYHYTAFNGRVIVHMIAHILLFAGNILFAAICVLMCLSMPIGMSKSHTATAIFLILIVNAPQALINEGMMWISAFCNYFVPSAMLCALIYLFESKQKTKLRQCLCALTALLCGAATEQMGMTCLVLCIFYLIQTSLTQRRFSLYHFICTLLCTAGLYSIFLSPATAQRLSTETSHISFFAKCADGFTRQVDILSQEPFTVVVISSLCMAMGIRTGTRLKCRACVIISIALGIILVSSVFAPKSFMYISYLLILSALLIYSVLLRQRVVLSLMLCALTSLMVMLPTSSIEPRTLLPFWVLLCLCSAVVLAPLFSKMSKSSIVIIAILTACITISNALPMVAAYTHNYHIDKINEKHAKDFSKNKILYYKMDYDMDYTKQKAFSDGYFCNKYIESVGLSQSVQKVYFYSDALPALYCNGQLMSFPALAHERGFLYPLREIIEALGGEVLWKGGTTVVNFDKKSYLIKKLSDGTREISYADGTIIGEFASSSGMASLCIEESFFTDVLKLEINATKTNIVVVK